MLQTVNQAGNRVLIPSPLWDRVVGRMEKNEHMPREKAERVMDATLGFLGLCAKNPGRRFSPSPLVDTGWHTFLMYTQGYNELCQQLAGHLIHHEPNDNPAVEMKSGGACATVAFMKSTNVPFDAEMWAHTSANDCTVDCDGGGGMGPDGQCSCS